VHQEKNRRNFIACNLLRIPLEKYGISISRLSRTRCTVVSCVQRRQLPSAATIVEIPHSHGCRVEPSGGLLITELHVPGKTAAWRNAERPPSRFSHLSVEVGRRSILNCGLTPFLTASQSLSEAAHSLRRYPCCGSGCRRGCNAGRSDSHFPCGKSSIQGGGLPTLVHLQAGVGASRGR